MKKMKKTKKAIKKKTKEEESLRDIKVRVIGIGGGGGSIISGVSSGLSKISFVAVNTDNHALSEVTKKRKIRGVVFGKKLTGGLGTGMDAKLGRQAAEEDIENIKKLFEEQDIVILVSSLGGGTGSGALPVFSEAAKEMGCLVYGLFTLPFSFEGEKKMKIAKEAVKESKDNLHAITILPNEKIFEIVDKNTPLKRALTVMNENLAENLDGLVETIYETGLVNIDFADVRAVLKNKRGGRKLTYLSTVEGRIEEGAEEIVKRAISNPIYPYKITSSHGILFNITGGKDIGLTDISSISESIAKNTDDDARIIVGIMQKNKYKDKVRVALLATGCQTDFFKKELDEKQEEQEKPAGRLVKSVGVKKKQEKIKTGKYGQENKKQEERKNKVTVVPSAGIEVHSAEEVTKKPETQDEKEILEEEEKWEKPSFLRKFN